MFAVVVDEVREAESALCGQLQRLVPGEVPLSEVESMWAAYDVIERHAAAAKTLLAAPLEASRSWSQAGERSAEDHMARTAGTSRAAAKRKLGCSKNLSRLPATEAALRRGELSSDQVETIADAAAVNPDAEQTLLDAARSRNLSELRDEANRAKAAGDPDPDATHRRIHRRRRLRRYTDGEGAWNLSARGTADAGAALNAALDPVIDEIFHEARRSGRHETRDAYTFDALITLARRARDGMAVDSSIPSASSETSSETSGGSAAPVELDGAAGAPLNGGTASGVRSRRRANPSHLALLRVDVSALRRGRVEGDELCEIAGVGAVPARVARDLLGDAVVKLVITRGVDVLNVTSLGRGPTAAQRIALQWTSPSCTNESCSNRLAIEHDHRTPWVDVLETRVDNLDRLCRPCHRRKTRDRWALVAGKGRRAFVPPDDPRHPANSTANRTRRQGPDDQPSRASTTADGRPVASRLGRGAVTVQRRSSTGRARRLATSEAHA